MSGRDRPPFTFNVRERARSPFWQARIFLAGEGGRERRWSTGVRVEPGARRAESKRAAERATEEHAAGLVGAADEESAAEVGDAALSEVADRMLASKEADGRRPRAVDALSFSLERHVLPFLGATRDVTTIRRADLEGLKANMREKNLAPSTINNALTAVRQVLKFACLVEERMESIPAVASVPVDPEPKGKALDVAEIEGWIEHVGTGDAGAKLEPSANGKRRQRTSEAEQEEARHLVTFIANTGVRREEALSIRFSWIDWDARLINVPARVTKGGRSRPPVAINDAVVAVLRARQEFHPKRREPKDDRVFRRNRRMTREATRAAERAGLGPTRLHDLRHSLGSLHVAAGATLTEVRDTLGHRTMDMVNRYQHSYVERRQATSDRVTIGAPSAPGTDPGSDGSRGEISQDQGTAEGARRKGRKGGKR